MEDDGKCSLRVGSRRCASTWGHSGPHVMRTYAPAAKPKPVTREEFDALGREHAEFAQAMTGAIESLRQLVKAVTGERDNYRHLLEVRLSILEAKGPRVMN